MKDFIRYLSLCGMLGYGYSPVSLENALKLELDFIGVDAGSTDPGPYYLGSGKGFVKRLQVKRDLSLILKEAKTRGIPLIIGSAGGSGAKPHVDSVLEIMSEIVREQGFLDRLLAETDGNGEPLWSERELEQLRTVRRETDAFLEQKEDMNG